MPTPQQWFKIRLAILAAIFLGIAIPAGLILLDALEIARMKEAISFLGDLGDLEGEPQTVSEENPPFGSAMPPKLASLCAEAARGKTPKDPWGRPWEVACPPENCGFEGPRFLVRSAGPDGVFAIETSCQALKVEPGQNAQGDDLVWTDGYFVSWP